jgi:hypothetical protein
MKSRIDEAFFSHLDELSKLVPQMRFGQLLLLLCEGEEGFTEVAEIDDESLLSAAKKQRKNLESRLEPTTDECSLLSPARMQLLRILEQMREAHPSDRFGQLVSEVSELAQTNLYDIEDERLLRFARKRVVSITEIDNSRWGDDKALDDVHGEEPGLGELADCLDAVDHLMDELSSYRNRRIAEMPELLVAE